MATNFEIIINNDAPVLRADGSTSYFTIADALAVLSDKNCKYIYAPHPADDMSSFSHYHLGIHTDSNNDFATIAKWFNLPVNAVQRIKSRFNSTYPLYLIHYDKEGKTPIDPSAVHANFNLDYDKLIANVKAATSLDDILNKIDAGEIREYDIYNHVDVATYAKHELKIKRAFEFRKQRIKGEPRNMDCIFITGDSGVGKTTYAKQIARDRGYDFYVSSGSNDVLDDYKGEPCIILDDLRPSCLSLSDLLKMLDNHTASSVKSRFRNKVLECKLIIITTTLPIATFFNEVFKEQPETSIQLMRRCKLMMTMTRDYINVCLYNERTRQYDSLSTMPNVVLAMYQAPEMSDEQKLDLACAILGSTGDLTLKLRDGIKNRDYIPVPDGDVSVNF